MASVGHKACKCHMGNQHNAIIDIKTTLRVTHLVIVVLDSSLARITCEPRMICGH